MFFFDAAGIMFRTVIAFFLTAYITFVGGAASAHEIRPAVADLYLLDGFYRLEITLNLEGMIAQIGAGAADTAQSEYADTYDRLRRLPAATLIAEFDQAAFARNLTILLDGTPSNPDVYAVSVTPVGDADLARDSLVLVEGALNGAAMIRLGWAAEYGQIIIRLMDDDNPYDAFLTAGALSDPISTKGATLQSFGSVFVNYLSVGFDHILPKGLDHILFVVGLFLLSTRLHPLLWQVTAFTLAHSVTLALGILGVVQVSAAIVEPLIAASIVYVCVENIFMTRLSRWRPVVIFGFGLLHGLGFAGVLSEFGLSETNLIPGLLGFNIGVELGQITVIAICFALVGFWFSGRDWYRRLITIPASLAIALVGSYWVIERTILA